MKYLISVFASLLTLVGCGSSESPTLQAEKASASVKKASNGTVAPVVKDVGSMALATQDYNQ